jgi:3-oxoacyl-[acyl-carrier-protein] synthase-1
MSANDPVIVSVGITTAVGLTARETAAAARSGTMRFTESDLLDHRFKPFTLAVVPDKGLPVPRTAEAGAPLTSREARLVRLPIPALTDCLAKVPASVHARVSIALPEAHDGAIVDPVRVLAHLEPNVTRGVDWAKSVAVAAGRAGGLIAIARAAELLSTGAAPFVLAGAVDTYRDLYVLGTMDKEKRVKSEQHLDGFVPGEGAAFLLLATRGAAAAAGLRPIASVSRVSESVETGHLYSAEPYRGEGLATAVAQLVATGAFPAPFGDVWSSMNGESHWGKEWGVTHIRNGAAFAEDHGLHHPADCFGDVGAACGPVLVGLAALGIRDGYRRSPALVCCSSDRALRATLAVSAP